jgi:hypothetical protein
MRHVAGALAGVAVSLLLVGVVSGTPVRHAVQVAPCLLALAAACRRAPWAAAAALPVFVAWLLIMLAIWLWLLGLARITTGRFTPAEIGLTIAVGASCAWGIAAVFRARSAARPAVRAAAAVVFGALQVGAVWLSLHPAIAAI